MGKTKRKSRSRARPTRITGQRLDEMKAASHAAPANLLVGRSFPTHDQIARRAYELWMQGGCPGGCDLEHWLEAEQQLGNLVSV